MYIHAYKFMHMYIYNSAYMYIIWDTALVKYTQNYIFAATWIILTIYSVSSDENLVKFNFQRVASSNEYM